MIAVKEEDNKQEESSQPPSQNEGAGTVKSVGFLDSNKEDVQSCTFPALKSKVERSVKADESETTKEHLIEICKVVIEKELGNKSLEVIDVNSELS